MKLSEVGRLVGEELEDSPVLRLSIPQEFQALDRVLGLIRGWGELLRAEYNLSVRVYEEPERIVSVYVDDDIVYRFRYESHSYWLYGDSIELRTKFVVKTLYDRREDVKYMASGKHICDTIAGILA